MSRHPVRLAVAVALVVAGAQWIVDTNPWSGPLVLRFTESHGVHTNDWVTFALWSLAFVVSCPAWSAASWHRLQRAVIDRSA